MVAGNGFMLQRDLPEDGVYKVDWVVDFLSDSCRIIEQFAVYILIL